MGRGKEGWRYERKRWGKRWGGGDKNARDRSLVGLESGQKEKGGRANATLL